MSWGPRRLWADRNAARSKCQADICTQERLHRTSQSSVEESQKQRPICPPLPSCIVMHPSSWSFLRSTRTLAQVYGTCCPGSSYGEPVAQLGCLWRVLAALKASYPRSAEWACSVSTCLWWSWSRWWHCVYLKSAWFQRWVAHFDRPQTWRSTASTCGHIGVPFGPVARIAPSCTPWA